MSRVDEIRKRLADKYFCGYSEIAGSDLSYLLARVEKLEGLLNAFAKHDNKHEKCWCGSVWSPHTEACIEARTLLADESKENEHGNK